jgi:hypothetical protein
MTRQRRSLLTKELDGCLRRRTASMVITRTKTLSSSYLGENLLLDVLGGQSVDHLLVLFLTGPQLLDLFDLFLHSPNEVVDHVGQLINLDVLGINMTVELINDPPYTVRSIPNEINMFFKTVDQVVLLGMLPHLHIFLCFSLSFLL